MTRAARLARPEILALPPCDIAGAPRPGTIRLDANENPFAPLVAGQPEGEAARPQAARQAHGRNVREAVCRVGVGVGVGAGGGLGVGAKCQAGRRERAVGAQVQREVGCPGRRPGRCPPRSP